MSTPENELWLRFLWTFALSDHLGDATEAVRGYAKKAGLPMPGKYAELSVDPGEATPENSWLAWIESQGVSRGIWGD